MAAFWETMAHWWVEYGIAIRLLLIVLGAVLARWILMFVLRRTVNRVVSGVKKSHDVELTAELSQSPKLAARMVQRTRTLGTVGGNLITWVVVLTALVMVLDQLGVSVAAIIASAGIVAAGLAFGAQNIVKDLLNGLFMVFEDQIGVGDLITVGDITGTVEAVGVRVTQVRDIEGALWFIRNGEILQLGNRSHGWARAIIDLEVETSTDGRNLPDEVLRIARDAVQRPGVSRKVLEMPALIALAAVEPERSAYRLLVKTRPGAQAEISRELRESIVTAFGGEGVTVAPEFRKEVWPRS